MMRLVVARLALVLLAAPLTVEAQQAGQIPRIALVVPNSSVSQMLGSRPTPTSGPSFTHCAPRPYQ